VSDVCFREELGKWKAARSAGAPCIGREVTLYRLRMDRVTACARDSANSAEMKSWSPRVTHYAVDRPACSPGPPEITSQIQIPKRLDSLGRVERFFVSDCFSSPALFRLYIFAVSKSDVALRVRILLLNPPTRLL
jgi:hypothetical protein